MNITFVEDFQWRKENGIIVQSNRADYYQSNHVFKSKRSRDFASIDNDTNKQTHCNLSTMVLIAITLRIDLLINSSKAESVYIVIQCDIL